METSKTCLLADNFKVNILGNYTLSTGFSEPYLPDGIEVVIKNMNCQRIKFSYFLVRGIEKGPIHFEFTLNEGLIEFYRVIEGVKNQLCRIPTTFIDGLIKKSEPKVLDLLKNKNFSLVILLSEPAPIRYYSGSVERNRSTTKKFSPSESHFVSWISMRDEKRPSQDSEKEVISCLVQRIFEDFK
jgi:hypothetical protein